MYLKKKLYLRTSALALPYTIPSSSKPFCSPVRLSPAIGVMSGAHYQSSIQELLHLVATFVKCSPYSSSLTIIHKTGSPVIHYPALRFQASLSEWWIIYEIDESIFFMNNCSLYLRMCIFCSTFAPWTCAGDVCTSAAEGSRHNKRRLLALVLALLNLANL